jgi:hypothetical protein
LRSTPITVPPSCARQNFDAIDRGLRDLLPLYLAGHDFEKLEPHFDRLGALAATRLDELARIAASSLYHITSAVLIAREASQLNCRCRGARCTFA